VDLYWNATTYNRCCRSPFLSCDFRIDTRSFAKCRASRRPTVITLVTRKLILVNIVAAALSASRYHYQSDRTPNCALPYPLFILLSIIIYCYHLCVCVLLFIYLYRIGTYVAAGQSTYVLLFCEYLPNLSHYLHYY
jgi:hypothetical protein